MEMQSVLVTAHRDSSDGVDTFRIESGHQSNEGKNVTPKFILTGKSLWMG